MEARLTGYGSAEYNLAMEQIFSDYEQTLFTKAVSVAESYGKTPQSRDQALTDFCQVLLCLNEFIYVD